MFEIVLGLLVVVGGGAAWFVSRSAKTQDAIVDAGEAIENVVDTALADVKDVADDARADLEHFTDGLQDKANEVKAEVAQFVDEKVLPVVTPVLDDVEVLVATNASPEVAAAYVDAPVEAIKKAVKKAAVKKPAKKKAKKPAAKAAKKAAR